MPEANLSAEFEGVELTDEEKDRLSAIEAGEDQPPPAPEPQEAAEPDGPAPDVEAPEPAEPEQPKKKGLRHQLVEERDARKAAEEERAALAEKLGELQTKWDAFNKQLVDAQKAESEQQNQQQKPFEVPSAEEQPFEHLNTRLGQIEGTLSSQLQQQQVMNQVGAMQQRFAGDLSSARSHIPDIDDALAYLTDIQTRNLEAFGYAPQQIQAMLPQIAHAQLDTLYRNNQHPAVGLYKLAMAQGYAGKQQPQPRPSSPATDLARIAAGQQDTAGLGGNGASPAQPVTLAQIADDPETFRKWYNKYGRNTKDMLQNIPD